MANALHQHYRRLGNLKIREIRKIMNKVTARLIKEGLFFVWIQILIVGQNHASFSQQAMAETKNPIRLAHISKKSLIEKLPNLL